MVREAHTMTLCCSNNKIILILEINYELEEKKTILFSIVKKSVEVVFEKILA